MAQAAPRAASDEVRVGGDEPQRAGGVAAVEVILTSGERLRIAPGMDAATLRLVLSVLREPR